MSESSTVFIVQLRHWGYDDERYYPEFMETLKAFRTREGAEAELRRLDQKEPPHSFLVGNNPFYSYTDTFSEVTSLSEEELLKKVTALEIPAPVKGKPTYFKAKYKWLNWWESLTKAQQEQVSPWLDGVSMYVVVEIPLSSVNVVNQE